MSRLIRESFRRIAAGEPGLIARSSPPISSPRLLRMASAPAGSPLAFSSITRSSMLAMKVTPQARTACRSTGDRKYGRFGSRRSAAELASMSPTIPSRRSAPLLDRRPRQAGRILAVHQLGAGRHHLRQVVHRAVQISTGLGPASGPGTQARPIKVARSRSSGNAPLSSRASCGALMACSDRRVTRLPWARATRSPPPWADDRNP